MAFDANVLPEMLRTDLQETCLKSKAHGPEIPVKDFLGAAIQPPSQGSIDHAMRQLVSLKALTHSEELTPLGKVLLRIPLHPQLGMHIDDV